MPSGKERNKTQKTLNTLLKSFSAIESELVKTEKDFIDLDRGLYKGIAVNVRDKLLKPFPLYLKFKNLNNHVGYTGTTRVGKTKNMICDAQQLIAKGWNVIIVDPKGGAEQEILTEIAQAALNNKRAEDYMYVSPAFPKESEHLNLLYGMEDDEIASLIKTFAISTSGDDGFFSGVVYENTLAVVKALTFIETATDPFGEYTEMLEKQELEKYMNAKVFKDPNANNEPSVTSWNGTEVPNQINLLSEEEQERDRSLIENLKATSSMYQNRSMVTFKILARYVTFKSINNLKTLLDLTITIPSIEYIGREKHLEILRLREEALSSLNKVLSTDETNFSKIAKTHSVLLAQLVFGDIGKVFSGIGINPLANKLLSNEGGLVCVMQPYPMKYKTVSNMAVMALLKSIENLMGMVGSSGRDLDTRLAIMIDEAGSSVYEGIDNLFNKAGGLGVSLFVYTQSYEDYALALDETSANVILDNVNTPITMRMNHPVSCKRAAESLGTVRKHKSMFMANDGGGSRFSVGSEDEEIALAEDVSKLPVGVGYMRHDGETYLVSFPYVKGLSAFPIEMPETDSEHRRKKLANFEQTIIQYQYSLSQEIEEIEEIEKKKQNNE